MTHLFKNDCRLGDCFWHCLFMRRAAKANRGHEFILHCKDELHAQLYEVIADIPSIKLASLEKAPPDAMNAWIGEQWASHPDHNDIILFLIQWFGYLAGKMGIRPVIQERADLLADYPALDPPIGAHYDFMVINSYPQSGQWGFDVAEMDRFIFQLSQRHKIIVTAKTKVPGIETLKGSVTRIGQQSCNCRAVIGCATGPFWPTANVWNARGMGENWHVFLREQHVNYGNPMRHYKTIADCVADFKSRGLL